MKEVELGGGKGGYGQGKDVGFYEQVMNLRIL